MNTWDRHGNGQRPDAPRNDLSRLRLSNQDQLHGPENINNTSSKKSQIFSTHEAQDDGIHGSLNHPSQQGSFDSTSRTSDVSVVAHIQSQKNYGNANNSRTSDQIKKETSFNQGAQMDKLQSSSKPDNIINDIQGRFLFARTRSSPELSDAYGEVTSQGRRERAPESGKNQTSSTRLDNTRTKNLELDRPTDDSSSVRHFSSRQSVKIAGDSRTGSNSYQDETGLGAMNDEFATVSGAQGMHQEEQDLVNMMASSAVHGFNGQVPVPLNLSSHHLPVPIPPSILASMGYGQRNMGGMIPTNIPLIDNPWGTNMQFPQGVVPPHLTHYFPGMGLMPAPEDRLDPANENFGSASVNSGEADHDVWHEQDRPSTGGLDLDNGGFEMLQTDDKQQSTSSGYNFSSSSRVGSSGSTRGHPKHSKENHGSARDDQIDDFQYHDNRGNEGHFDDRTASSRSLSASHAGSIRSKTSSESSWEGSSAKVSKSTRDKRGRKTSSFSVPAATHEKDKSVSEHSPTQADDDNRDWSLSSPIGAEVAERRTVPHSAASWQVSRHQIPGFEPAQSSGSDSLLPFSPMVLNPHPHQRAADGSGVLPITFYATGPPVPFVTMLPVYNFPGEAGTSDASTSHFSGDAGFENNDSGHSFDSSERLDQKHASITSDLMKQDTSLEPSERKADILNGDFASHLKNLQFGRFCQDLRYPAPVYQPPVPVYLQGRVPWDGPGRPLSGNMNLLTQIMGYGPRIVPVAPLQTMSNRPTGVYQRYVEEMPRYRTGTGTYLPNPVR